MNAFSAIFQQTSWQIIGKVVTSLSTFIILGLVARNFHEAGTGIFTLALTYLNIFNLLGDFGFNAHVLKKSTFEWQKLLGTRLLWSIILMVAAIALLPFWPFATADFSKAVIFGSVGILGSAVFVTCNLIFQNKLRYDLSVLASSVGTIFGLFAIFWFSSKGFPISFLLIAQSLGWLIIALFSLILIKKFVSKVVPLFDIQYIKSLFKESWPIAATLALNVVYFRADAFLLAHFRGLSDVGIYNVAYSVFQSALVIPTFIMNAYYPLMLKSLSKVKLVGFGLVGLGAVGTAVTLVLSPGVIQIFTGGAFLGSVEALRILSLGFPAFFLSALLMWYLVTKGKYKQMLLIYAIGLIVNLVLNFYFIPAYSFIGAAWVTVFCEYLILALQAVVLSIK